MTLLYSALTQADLLKLNLSGDYLVKYESIKIILGATVVTVSKRYFARNILSYVLILFRSSGLPLPGMG